MVICIWLELVEAGNLDLGHPITWISIFLAGLIVSTALVFTFALLVPSLLSLVELWGVTLVFMALLSPLWNGVQSALELPGWMDCVFLMGAFVLVHYGLYGDWQNRFGAERQRSTRRSVDLKADPQTVWRALRPDPERAGDHYWPGTSFLPKPEGKAADFVMVRPRRAGLKDETTLVTITGDIPGKGFTMTSRAAFESEDETPDITFVVTLEPTASGGTQLHIEERLSRFRLGQALQWWLSNDLADHLSCIQAKIDGRRDGSIHGYQMLRGVQSGSMSPPARAA